MTIKRPAISARALWRRLFRKQEHLIFQADCIGAVSAIWPPQELPVRFSAAAPLSPTLRTDLLRLRPHDHPYLRAVDRGEAHGLVVCVEGVIVHSAYLMLRNKTTCLLGFPRHIGLLGNSFTAGAYRGRGCQARSARERLAMAAQAGLSSVISETQIGNLASQRGLQNGGMRLIGLVRLVVILNLLVVRTARPHPEVARCSVCI